MEHKKPRLAPFLLLAGCALPILLMLIVPFRGQLTVSDAENRSLAQFPALTLEGFISGDFQQQLEDALGDQYPFGEEITTSPPSLAAASISEAATLFESPTQTILTPSK